MTIEEAIKILDLETCQEALSPYLDRSMCEMLDAIIEASRMGASALRTRPDKLDRSRWEGCEYCKDIPKSILKGFCYACGRPLTEDAWAEMERRMGGG